MKFFSFKPRYPYLFVFLSIFLVSLLSFLAYFYPSLQPYFLFVLFAIILALSLYKLEYGVLAAVVELIVGSKGHLLAADLFGFLFSLRMAIWLALLLASFVFILRTDWGKLKKEYLLAYPFKKSLLVFVAFILLGFVNALWRHNSPGLILADGNVWFFLALIIPFIFVYLPYNQEKLRRLLKISWLALLFLILESLFFLFAFSHHLAFIPDLYLWIRRSGLGEITAMGGGWYRIFIQSQVYLPIAFFFLLIASLKERINWRSLSALALVLSVVIISLSRSFWLALAIAAFVGAVFYFRLNWRLWLKALAYIAISGALALALVFVVTKFPYPSSGASVSGQALSERLNTSGSDAAVASRWALLPPLVQGIKEAPLLGHGFGATISYHSSDPRVLENNPSGLYTTYAFEWAYLDTWLKIGFFGLAALLFFLLSLMISAWKKEKTITGKTLYPALALGIFFLMVVNIFTPYINHPLGLSFIMLASCFLPRNLL